MASDYRVDLIFEGFQKALRGSGKAFGWIETYYCSVASVDAALAAAGSIQAPATQSLAGARLMFLSDVWRISYFRATDIRNPRVTKVASPTNLTGKYDSIRSIPAQVQCAVAATTYRLPAGTDTQAHRRNVALRGLPSSLINGNVLNTGSPAFTAVQAFLDLVGRVDGSLLPAVVGVQPFWLMGYQDVTVIGQRVTGVAVVADDPHFINLTSPGVGNVVKGDRVILKGVTNLRGVNRTWRVIQDTLAGQPILLGRTKFPLDTGAAPAFGSASARLKRTVVNPANQYVIRGLTTRKTGRPINPLRGRASARP